jgi:hypothetical protein
MEDTTIKFGLLMEAAQAQQVLAEAALEKLNAHTRELDTVVRDEIRHTLVEELQLLGGASQRAAEDLRRLSRSANVRMATWSVGLTLLCTAIPFSATWWLLPTQSELATLRAKRDELTANIARLERRGGGIHVSSCGTDGRVCVQVDRKAPVYGKDGDYFVAKGR